MPTPKFQYYCSIDQRITIDNKLRLLLGRKAQKYFNISPSDTLSLATAIGDDEHFYFIKNSGESEVPLKRFGQALHISLAKYSHLYEFKSAKVYGHKFSDGIKIKKSDILSS